MRAKKIRPLLILIFLSAILFSCGIGKEGKYDEYARAYTDILFLKHKYGWNKDTLTVKIDSIFTHYQISGKEYNLFFESIKNDEGKWKRFFDLSEKYLDSLRHKK